MQSPSSAPPTRDSAIGSRSSWRTPRRRRMRRSRTTQLSVSARASSTGVSPIPSTRSHLPYDLAATLSSASRSGAACRFQRTTKTAPSHGRRWREPFESSRRRACRSSRSSRPRRTTGIATRHCTGRRSSGGSRPIPTTRMQRRSGRVTSARSGTTCATSATASAGRSSSAGSGREQYSPLGSQQASQHVREDPAVPEILALARRVEAHDRAELLVVRTHGDLVCLTVLDSDDRELLAPRQAQ